MTIESWYLWIPSITVTSALAIIVWLFRKSLFEWISSSIRSKYDKEIEELKHSLKQKGDEIEALRGGVLSGAITRHELLYGKQVQASEIIWKAIICLSPGKSLSYQIFRLNFQDTFQQAAEDESVKELFKIIGNQFNWKDIKHELDEAKYVRPFVTPSLWAYYSAYESIIIYAVSRCEILKNASQRIEKIIMKAYDANSIIKLLEETLPDRKDYVRQSKEKSLYVLLDDLESKVLVEIDSMLSGEQIDQIRLEQAAKIIKAADELNLSSKLNSAKVKQSNV